MEKTKLEDYIELPLQWKPTADLRCPYVTQWGTQQLALYMNEFPEEPPYALFLGERGGEHHLGVIVEWPRAWIKT